MQKRGTPHHTTHTIFNVYSMCIQWKHLFLVKSVSYMWNYNRGQEGTVIQNPANSPLYFTTQPQSLGFNRDAFQTARSRNKHSLHFNADLSCVCIFLLKIEFQDETLISSCDFFFHAKRKTRMPPKTAPLHQNSLEPSTKSHSVECRVNENTRALADFVSCSPLLFAPLWQASEAHAL